VKDAQPYGQAEFAFKGARDHMRWWFRIPAFEAGLVSQPLLQSAFDSVNIRNDGEVITDIRNVDDARKMILFLGPRLKVM